MTRAKLNVKFEDVDAFGDVILLKKARDEL
jgi:hypothetical protein